MSNPFAAAEITPLFGMDWALSLLRVCREINKDKPEHQKWIDEAYRVLEAAGKVEPEGLAFFLKQRNLLMPSSVRALLESLPESDAVKP